MLVTLLCGALVGFSLGLIGGGGSILAVPLLMYAVGVHDPHVAIGTSACAVGLNALVNLLGHWRRGTVHWPSAATFALAGVLGATLGSSVGKLMDGSKLLLLFAGVMIAVGIAMLRPDTIDGGRTARISPAIVGRLLILGLLAGLLAGFFGIGGGFLIVPGLMLATDMPILNAIGSSLLSVTAFGLTTATSYALSGLIDWPIAGQFVLGGVAGSMLGIPLALRIGNRRGLLARVFAAAVFALAAYMIIRSLQALRG